MKNLYDYKEFLNEKNNQLNEGLFGFLKKMFNKVSGYAKQIKESGEIDKKFETAKKDLEALFNDQIDDIIKDKAAELIKVQEAVEDTTLQNPNKTQEPNKTQDPNKTKEVPQKKTQEKEVNPIDEAINNFIENVKIQFKVYIESENKKVKFYALAKLSELNQFIIQKKIAVYKSKKNLLSDEVISKLVESEAQKLKQEEEKGKEIVANLEKVVQNVQEDKSGIDQENIHKGEQVKPEDIKKDDVYIYMTKDQKDNEVKTRITITGDKVIDGNIKATYSPAFVKQFNKSKDEQDFSVDNIFIEDTK